MANESVSRPIILGAATANHLRVFYLARQWFAYYYSEFDGVVFNPGVGKSPDAAVRDLWRRLHDSQKGG